MKKIVSIAFLLALASPAVADIIGKPTVIAGDIMIVDGVRVHLHGIDAPEPNQVCFAKGKNYSCGLVARTALMDLVAGVSVNCRIEDTAGRVAAYRYAYCEAGGFDLSSNMVHTGWALADRASTDKYVAVEQRAKEAKRGLWRGKFAPPWEWRGR